MNAARAWCERHGLDGYDWPGEHLFHDFGSEPEVAVMVEVVGEVEPSRAYILHRWEDGSAIIYQGDIWDVVDPGGCFAWGSVLDWD